MGRRATSSGGSLEAEPHELSDGLQIPNGYRATPVDGLRIK